MPRVVISDECRVFAESLRFVLEARGFDVVGCVSDPGAGVAAVARDQPDLYLVDVSFPGGLAGLRQALVESPTTRALALTGMDRPMAADDVRKTGAVGLVHKDRPIDQILEAVDQVIRGRIVFDKRADAASRDGYAGVRTSAVDVRLTPREREVLRGLVEGQSTVQLAGSMGIMYSTARTHIQRLLNKLGVHSKLEAVALVTESGFLNEPEIAPPATIPVGSW